jgi:hypothetical protein
MHFSPRTAILLSPLVLAAAWLTAVEKSAAADLDTAVADERAIPRDYVTLFPTWQRDFIHEGRLIHAAGEDGIMQALFSIAMDKPRGADSRVLPPFIHLDSDSRNTGRLGPSPANSIDPALPPLLHCWDVDHGQFMLVFGRMRPWHDYRLRIYSLDSIGGPVREIPGIRALHDRELYPDADISLVHDLQNNGRGQDRFRSTALEESLEHNPTLHFSIRLLPEQRFEMLVQRLGGWRKDLVETSAGRTREGHIEFLPAYPPEPFFHFTARGQYFLARQSGPLEMIPDEYLREKTWRTDEPATPSGSAMTKGSSSWTNKGAGSASPENLSTRSLISARSPTGWRVIRRRISWCRIAMPRWCAFSGASVVTRNFTTIPCALRSCGQRL